VDNCIGGNGASGVRIEREKENGSLSTFQGKTLADINKHMIPATSLVVRGASEHE